MHNKCVRNLNEKLAAITFCRTLCYSASCETNLNTKHIENLKCAINIRQYS